MKPIEVMRGDQYCNTPTGESVLWVVQRFQRGQMLSRSQWTIIDLLLAGFCLVCMVGCSEASTELTAWQKSMRDGSAEAVEVAKQVEKKQDASIVILRDHSAALLRIEKQLEASLSAPKPNGQEVIKSAPSPPAKANTAATPSKLATPGDFSEPETLVELATRLYASGVNVHNKTREELEAIDAQMQGVKSSPVQYVTRPTYQSGCPGGVCHVPQRVSRKGKR